ncbi:MAG: hypothetical protein H6609_17325 [Ignavibacteriales bacterium]|nr:hypothetical protein [Ignavibacteriales bacterium]
MKKMIFYHPVGLVEKPSKGSEIRPIEMLQAFEDCGYEVEKVIGDSGERKKAIKRIKAMVKNGVKFDFLYGESSNIPILLADSHHLPIRPFQDYLFFRFLNKNSIPIGYFLRDLYWKVKGIRLTSSFFQNILIHFFHKFEWPRISRTINYLFLPTLSLSKHLPSDFPQGKLFALPPGCLETIKPSNKQDLEFGNGQLKLFYVGGVTPPYYDLSSMIKIVSELKGLKLIICTRKDEWELEMDFYKDFDFTNIKIVHANQNEIEVYYKWADLILDIRSNDYFTTAMPIKIIEAIGFEVPVILLDGSEAARFVESEGTGWVFNNINEVKLFLGKLKFEKDDLDQKVQYIKSIKSKHTWKARALEAATILNQKM